jgi:hypothetical protein
MPAEAVLAEIDEVDFHEALLDRPARDAGTERAPEHLRE